VLENRTVLKFVPDLFRTPAFIGGRLPAPLVRVLRHCAPQAASAERRRLTPGIHNSAYFEHTLLARRMGVELVEAAPHRRRRRVYVKTTTASNASRHLTGHRRRLSRPALLSARVDARRDGLMNAYRAGNVTLAQPIGSGVPTTALYRTFRR